MAKRINNRSVVFKAYSQHQLMAFPPSLDELIAAGHPVRVVNQVVDQLDLEPLIKLYKGGGASNYHPKMLLKVLVYAYMTNVYSSRKMEAAVQENIHFMWLSGMARPDHHTLNRFRSQRLKDSLRKIFDQVVLLLNGEGLLSIKDICTDGTKIEANANRYTFVWGNSIKTNKEKIKKQLGELWRYAQQVAEAETDLPEPPDFDKATIDSEQVKQAVEQIDKALRDNPNVSNKVRAKLDYAKKNWPANLEKYAAQQGILGERNSYSKTDTDATFMRLKEDHMKNGQLKPAYNLQVSSSGQYIVNYTVHQDPTDTTTLIGHLDQHRQSFGANPGIVTADAGYGSEQNYQHLEEEQIGAYVKYGYFDKEQSAKDQRERPFTIDKLHYNERTDTYICPMGQRMSNIGTSTTSTANGFGRTLTRYQAVNCGTCPLNGRCHKQKGDRVIEVNHRLNRHKKIAKERLNSEEGVGYRKRRPVDIEPIFGNIKQNHGFRRFMLRGKEKVAIETGLLAIAHNLRKKAA